MNLKRILITALISLVAAGLISVVLVGMINDEWPWARKFRDFIYNGLLPTQTTAVEDTTGQTEDTTLVTEETQESTDTVPSEETQESTVETTENNEETTGGTIGATDPSLGVTVEDPNASDNTGPTNPSENKDIDFDSMYDGE